MGVAVQGVRDMVAEFESISMKMAEPGADIESLTSKMDRIQVSLTMARGGLSFLGLRGNNPRLIHLQSQLDAINGWEIDRTLDQAMDSLRCPPPEALVNKLSGGEGYRC